MSTTAPVQDDHSLVEGRAPNVAQMFLDRVAESSTREAYRFPDGTAWVSRTWRETADEVTGAAAGLVTLGVEPEQRVAIASTTRYEWVVADLAIMCAGAATTTVYPSTMAEDVAYILSNSDSRVVFAEDASQVDKLRQQRSDLENVSKVVVIDTDGVETDDWVISLAQLSELGRQRLEDNPDTVDERVAAIDPDSLATLIYTSGTTGKPKGCGCGTAAGRTRARPLRQRASSTRATCSTCGCRWRTRSARCC